VPEPESEPDLRPVPPVPPVIPFPTRPTAGTDSNPESDLDPDRGPQPWPWPVDDIDTDDDERDTDCYTLNRVDRIDAALAITAVAQGDMGRMNGRANALVSNYMGTRWVSAAFAGSPWPPTTYHIISPPRISFQIYLSGDGHRQYRTPQVKPNQGGIKQSNFQWRPGTTGRWLNQEHLVIDATCPNFSK
jgi:hypothetical protein